MCNKGLPFVEVKSKKKFEYFQFLFKQFYRKKTINELVELSV